MFDLITFEYLGHRVRSIKYGSVPLFAAKDACDILKHSNPTEAVNRHVNPRHVRNLTKREVWGEDFPNRGMTMVTEAGLYDLIFGSKLPAAEEFKAWVTETVLPAIRRHGMYVAGEEKVAVGEMSLEELSAITIQRLNKKIAEMQAEKRRLEEIVKAAVEEVTMQSWAAQNRLRLSRSQASRLAWEIRRIYQARNLSEIRRVITKVTLSDGSVREQEEKVYQREIIDEAGRALGFI